MNSMSYKGYSGTADFSYEDRIFHGVIADINDVVTYEGNSIDELEASFIEAVDDYLALCKSIDKSPEKPYNGVFQVRLKPVLHRKLAVKAKRSGVSQNAYINKLIKHSLEES